MRKLKLDRSDCIAALRYLSRNLSDPMMTDIFLPASDSMGMSCINIVAEARNHLESISTNAHEEYTEAARNWLSTVHSKMLPEGKKKISQAIRNSRRNKLPDSGGVFGMNPRLIKRFVRECGKKGIDPNEALQEIVDNISARIG